MKVVFPKVEQELIDFLNRCKLKDSQVILCPCCTVVFDKEATKELEKINPYQSIRGGRQDKQRESFFNKQGVPKKPLKSKTYIPPSNVHPWECIGPALRSTTNKGKWKLIEVGTGYSYHNNSQTSNKYSYISKNYMGKKYLD